MGGAGRNVLLGRMEAAINTPLFDAQQMQYLSTLMTDAQLNSLSVFASTGDPAAIGAVEAVLSGTRLTGPDKAEVIEHVKAYLATASVKVAAPAAAGFKAASGASKVVGFKAAGPAAPVAPSVVRGVSIAEQVAALLTVTKQDGTVIKKGLAKVYRDTPDAWPAVDCFGRPFPSLTEILAMPKVQAKDYFTGSGFPRVKLDGLRYYVHEKAGTSLTIKNQLLQQQADLQEAENAAAKASNRAPQPIVIDPATIPQDIKAGDWRWWNDVRGEGAQYDTPARHKETCARLGILPIQYERLASQPAVTAAPAPAKRSRRAKV